MTKKILHIAWQMTIGGLERAIYQLIRAQRDAGIRADLLVASVAGFYGKKTRGAGAKIFELGQSSGMDLFIKNKFLNIIENYDILHFHAASPVLMHIASRKKDNRLYYTHRGGFFKFPLRRLFMYKLTGYLLRKSFNGISSNTQHGAHSASKLFKIPQENISITYNGINFSLLEPQRKKEEILRELNDTRNDITRIGTSANIRDWKRIDYLLRAISEIRDIPIHCYIVGDGPARPYLEKLSNDLNINDCVTFTGKKEHIGDYLQIVDIFVLPSGPEESFGNAAVEAMGLGIPVIIMQDGGGLLEHITNGGGFIAKNISDITRYIKELSLSRELRARVGETGRNYVRNKYSIDNMLRGYEKFYALNAKHSQIKNSNTIFNDID